MPLSAAQLAKLNTELTTNPVGLSGTVPGIGTETLTQMVNSGRFQDAALLLNTQGTVAGATVATGVLPVQQFKSAVVAAEFMALSTATRSDMHDVLDDYDRLYGGVPLNDPGTWGSVIPSYFPSTAPLQPGHTANTYQQLQSLKTRACSRAESLFEAGVTLDWRDIANAMGG